MSLYTFKSQVVSGTKIKSGHQGCDYKWVYCDSKSHGPIIMIDQ
jgi:hypothetical protein